MDENQENRAEDLKQETMNTLHEAKEQMKNINLKEEAEVGKGLLKKLWKNPIETVKEIAADKENKTFKTALLLVVVWAAIELVKEILHYLTNEYASFSLMSTLKATIAPMLTVIAMTLALYFVNNRAKVSVSKVLTSVSIAYVPSIISSLLWILYQISYKMSTILSPVSSILNVLKIVLLYHTTKEFVKKDNEENAFKDFVKVQAIYYVIVLAISFLGISL